MFLSFQITQVLLWTLLTVVAVSSASLVSANDLMKCSYGERGSLTATCVRANASFFRTTPYRFDQLDETLKCLDCSLKTIESNTFDISGNMIRNLVLRSSGIEMMKPKAFIGLIFLENLDLSVNDIRSIYPGTFTGIKKIKKIDLSHNKINILSDDGFLELMNLEDLNLERNNIRTISSKAFNGLEKLSILRIGYNQINDITNVFSTIINLNILDLENNQITSLTGLEFENSTALLDLNLAGNKILKPVLQIMPNNSLKRLSLQSNSIKEIQPDFFKTLRKLETLDLSFNYIDSISYQDFESLYHLSELDLFHNGLTKIHTGVFTGLPQLELLNVSNNKISDILITGVFSLHSLHSLDISFNSLHDLDYVGLISRLPSLTYLKLDNNPLPCDLEKEMQEYFEEDNFKVVFNDLKEGSIRCLDTPVKQHSPKQEKIIQTISSSTNIGSLEIIIFVIVCLIALSVGYLYYLQYRTHQNLSSSAPSRGVSTVHLVPADVDNRSDEFA